MMSSLPADFFINIVCGDRISINSFDPLDVGITIGLIGTALYAVPNVYCRSIATVLISWGSLETYQNWQQLRMERKQREKERRKREQKRQQGRDCSQCSKKCRDCPYCRKRQGW